jgi:hypothetical protein
VIALAHHSSDQPLCKSPANAATGASSGSLVAGVFTCRRSLHLLIEQELSAARGPCQVGWLDSEEGLLTQGFAWGPTDEESLRWRPIYVALPFVWMATGPALPQVPGALRRPKGGSIAPPVARSRASAARARPRAGVWARVCCEGLLRLRPPTRLPLADARRLWQQALRVAERRPAVSLAGRIPPPRDTPRRSRRTSRRRAFPPPPGKPP